MDTFFELSLQPMALANRAGCFERVNSAFAEVLGYALEELTQRPFLHFVHPEDQVLTEAATQKLAHGESVTDFENRYRCQDGQWKWLSWRASMDPASGHIFAVAHDITAVKSTEDAWAESETRFRMLVDGIRDYALIMLDVDGNVRSWNTGAKATKRFSTEEILGQPVACLYTPEDVAAGKPARDLALAKEQGRAEDTGWRIRGDGTRYWANVVINPLLNRDGQLQGFVKITRDVTWEHEASEKLFRQQSLLESLMENLAEGVVACDEAENLTFFNKTAREWHGQDVSDLPPAGWTDAFDLCAGDGVTPLKPDEIPLVRASRGDRVRGVEMSIVVKGAPPRFIEASGDPLFDESGRKIGAVVVMHDITERRLAERTVLRTQRMESIGMLAGGIAHDLNNALAPVLMAIELLKQRYPDSSALINTMEVSSRRGAGMVKQLLTFAKGTGGDVMAVKLELVVREIESLIECTFPKHIKLTIDCAPSTSPVEGDPTQLHQVFLNLCVNARDAMPEGGELTITVQEITLDSKTMPRGVDLALGDYVEIRVADTGEGIPGDIMDQVFEPFFTTKASDQGTGLGLATVQGIVRSHQGALRIDSQVGAGTTFHIYLPILSKSSHADTRNPLVDLDLEGDGRTVLLIDDESSIREVGRSVMDALGFNVITANNGVEALRIMQTRGSELSAVITDKDMPEMDGMALIEKARALLPEVPLVLSSGTLGKAEADQIRELGVAAILEKPFAQNELARVLHHALSRDEAMGYSRTPWN